MLNLFPVVMVVGVPWVLGWIARSGWQHQQFMRVVQLKAELTNKLVDRASTDPAALELLKSDLQQRLFDVRLPNPPAPVPHARVLAALQASCLLLAGGVGSLVLRANLDTTGDRSALLFLGTFGVALGIGAALAGVTAFVAARMMHTLDARA